MDFSVALASRLFILGFIPFLSYTINGVYISWALCLIAILLSLQSSQEGFSPVHHHLKHPKTLSVGFVLSSVLLGIDNASFFALGLCLIAVIMYFSAQVERSENSKILGSRYDLYARWVSDFLPGSFPVAQLPKAHSLSFKDRISKMEGTLFASATLTIFGGFVAVYRPFHANTITVIIWVASSFLFMMRFPLKTWPRLLRSRVQR